MLQDNKESTTSRYWGYNIAFGDIEASKFLFEFQGPFPFLCLFIIIIFFFFSFGGFCLWNLKQGDRNNNHCNSSLLLPKTLVEFWQQPLYFYLSFWKFKPIFKSLGLMLRTVKQEHGDAFEIHCSRERSRAAWKIIEEVLEGLCMPFFPFEVKSWHNKH